MLITPPFHGLQCKCLNLRQPSKTSVNGEKQAPMRVIHLVLMELSKIGQ